MVVICNHQLETGKSEFPEPNQWLCEEAEGAAWKSKALKHRHFTHTLPGSLLIFFIFEF